ncbi:hypothetical protein GDO86_009038 [Hymenochirus boettgeri]|uniref:Uncharacterized protein n=1 Tax=Hymenochirus boettgeri TaxID=247094 RepID=A0A8T2JM84_9PIPI|nr:hypothetical protein GDO86_009038 [Hymenochirus boettgeri]
MRKLGNTIWTKILDCPPNLSHCLKLRAALLTMRKKWCKSSSGLPRLKNTYQQSWNLRDIPAPHAMSRDPQEGFLNWIFPNSF